MVAIMVYDFTISDYQRYLKIRAAKKDILSAFPKEQRVKRHPNMKSSEWLVLPSPTQIKKLRDKMEEVAAQDGVRVSWFGESHEIKWPIPPAAK